MKRPGVRGEELAGGFEPGVGVPELGGEEEAAEGFGAAGVDGGGGLGWAGEEGGLEDAGVVEGGGVGVERCDGDCEKCSDGEKTADHGDSKRGEICYRGRA